MLLILMYWDIRDARVCVPMRACLRACMYTDMRASASVSWACFGANVLSRVQTRCVLIDIYFLYTHACTCVCVCVCRFVYTRLHACVGVELRNISFTM